MTGEVQIRLPPQLAMICGASFLKAQGDTVMAALKGVTHSSPALALHLFDEGGKIRPQIICLHGGEVVRPKDMAARKVCPGDEIILTNALSAG